MAWLKFLKSVLLREVVEAGRATVAAEIPVGRLFRSSGRCDGAYNRVAQWRWLDWAGFRNKGDRTC